MKEGGKGRGESGGLESKEGESGRLELLQIRAHGAE